MKKTLLITKNIPLEHRETWEKWFDIDMPADRYHIAEIREKIKTAHYLIACQTNVDEALLQMAPQLCAVNSYGVGYDSIDVAACKRHEIFVTNTPHAVTESTAELAIALLLSLVRRIPQTDRKVREQTAQWGIMKNQGFSLIGKQLGIVGLGRIGKSMARRAQAMGMQVSYFNRNRLIQGEEELLDVKYKSFEELLSSSDAISVHTPLSKSSLHLFNQQAFSLMKSSAYLVNTSRGKVVDEEALVEALEQSRLAGAALDVFAHEPQVHPGLLRSEKTVLLPHVGPDVLEVALSMTQEALEGFLAIERKETPHNLV